jgi:hypothetical protein
MNTIRSLTSSRFGGSGPAALPGGGPIGGADGSPTGSSALDGPEPGIFLRARHRKDSTSLTSSLEAELILRKVCPRAHRRPPGVGFWRGGLGRSKQRTRDTHLRTLLPPPVMLRVRTCCLVGCQQKEIRIRPEAPPNSTGRNTTQNLL